jgi:hypothetical protein
MDSRKRGVEMGAIVVIAVDNMIVVMARNRVRMRAITVIVVIVLVIDIGVAVIIDIIVRAHSAARVIVIAGRETAAAVMLSRTIGTLI